LAVREFKSNQCQLNASALTFYSLLSVVPIAAVAFGVAQGFGFEKLLEKQLLEKFPGQQETITQIIVFANNLLENTRGGLIAGLGVILLFWTVIKVLDNVEASFNDIWG
jgi:membrane protein